MKMQNFTWSVSGDVTQRNGAVAWVQRLERERRRLKSWKISWLFWEAPLSGGIQLAAPI